MIDFEWTIKFGDILTVIGAAYVGSTLLYKRGGDNAKAGKLAEGISVDIDGIKDELKKLAQVITTLAVQDTKIANLASQHTMLQRTVEDMRRGTGYVGTPARSTVDGEY